MRALLLAVLLLAVFSATAICQIPEQSSAERSVRVMLKQLSERGYDLRAEGPLNRLGDAASVALTQIVAGQKPSAKEIENMLIVIRMAFGAPLIVEVEADRQPRTTLFVLQYLESLAADAKLKKRIAETRHFVVEQAKKASKSQ